MTTDRYAEWFASVEPRSRSAACGLSSVNTLAVCIESFAHTASDFNNDRIPLAANDCPHRFAIIHAQKDAN